MNDRTYGIEIELEGAETSRFWQVLEGELGADVFDYWNVTKDGSLRGCAVEVVSEILLLQDVEKALDEIKDDLKVCTPTERCGVHVHMGTGKMKVKDIAKFLTLYLSIEQAIFYITGTRGDSAYCVPVCQSEFRGTLKSFIQDEPPYTKGELASWWKKYSALNTIPLADKNTLEFRHHKGTTNIKEILDFVTLINNMQSIVLKDTSTVGEFKRRLFSLNITSEYEELMANLFKGTSYFDEFLFEEVRQQIRRSVFLAKSWLS